MSPELALVAIVVLLWGPTVAWLVYRLVRVGQESSGLEPMAGGADAGGARPDDVAALVNRDGFWVCAGCHSLNRPDVDRCYSCRAARQAPTRAAPLPVPAPLADVMAAALTEPATGPRSPASDEGGKVLVTRSARTRDRNPGRAVIAVLDGTPARRHAPGSAVQGPAACPLLGLPNDPSTRYDFPDPRNVCHAQPGGSSGSRLAWLPRFGRAGRDGQAVPPAEQASRCLTPACTQCDRFVAAKATGIVVTTMDVEPHPVPAAWPVEVPAARTPDPAAPVVKERQARSRR